jgi:hypothetical protein
MDGIKRLQGHFSYLSRPIAISSKYTATKVRTADIMEFSSYRFTSYGHIYKYESKNSVDLDSNFSH